MTTIEEYRAIKFLNERLSDIQDLAWNRSSDLTLWIGAGFGKHYANLPIWAELLSALCSCDVAEQDKQLINQLINSGRLTVAAELLTEIRSHKLIDHVCELFKVESFDSESNPLSRLSPGIVITTNYDLLTEFLFPDYRILEPRQPIESIFSFIPKLIKIHGSIANPETIVLNVTSYARTYNKEFEWFLLHVFQNSTVLFIGAGLSESEPYMRYIRLLKTSNLLQHHHYALTPFQWMGSEESTNDVIRDRGNYLETLGIRIFPYVVNQPGDHRFVDDFLHCLCPPTTNAAVDRRIKALEAALDSFGPDRVGPSLFRAFHHLDYSNLCKTPFLNLVTKFLKSIREGKRFDLAAFWSDEFEMLVNHQEEQSLSKFNETSPHKYKLDEAQKNKAFLFDVQRTLKPSRSKKHSARSLRSR